MTSNGCADSLPDGDGSASAVADGIRPPRGVGLSELDAIDIPATEADVRTVALPEALVEAERLLAASAAAGDGAGGRSFELAVTRDCGRGRGTGGVLRLAARFSGSAEDSADCSSVFVSASLQEPAGEAGEHLCTSIACSGAECRRTVGLCPHAAASLLHFASDPRAAIATENEAPAWAAHPAGGSCPQLGGALAGRAIDAAVAAFQASRPTLWFCPEAHFQDRWITDEEEVLSTHTPHEPRLRVQQHVGSRLDRLQPVPGAPSSDLPLYYSKECCHRLLPENRRPGGGDPRILATLLPSVRELAWQLRWAGYLAPAAGALLRLASGIATVADDAFLSVYESGDRTPLAHIAALVSEASRTFEGLSLIALDERLPEESRQELASSALKNAVRLRVQCWQSFPSLESSTELEDACEKLFLHDKISSSIRFRFRIIRSLVRTARLARAGWDCPVLRSVLAGSASDADVETLRQSEPPGDLRARCLYLIARGRLEECVRLSKVAGVIDAIVSVTKHLTGRADRAISAALEAASESAAGCLRLRHGEFIDPGPDLPKCYECSSRKLCDECHKVGASWMLYLETVPAACEGLERLRLDQSTEGDDVGRMWLAVAHLEIQYTRGPLTPPAELLQSVIRAGMEARSRGASSATDCSHESAEAVRIGRLPLAEAYEASALQPGLALEAALVRLARLVGKYPTVAIEGRHTDAPPHWFAALDDAGLRPLAARFYLHSRRVLDLGDDGPFYWRAENVYMYEGPSAEDTHRVADALFGSVAACSADRVGSLSSSLLAAWRGASGSALGEAELESPAQYEALLVACALRLDAIGRFDEALGIARAVLEGEDYDRTTIMTCSRRQLHEACCVFFWDLVLKKTIAWSRSSCERREAAAIVRARTPLIVSAGEDAVRAFVDSTAWQRLLPARGARFYCVCWMIGEAISAIINSRRENEGILGRALFELLCTFSRELPSDKSRRGFLQDFDLSLPRCAALLEEYGSVVGAARIAFASLSSTMFDGRDVVPNRLVELLDVDRLALALEERRQLPPAADEHERRLHLFERLGGKDGLRDACQTVAAKALLPNVGQPFVAVKAALTYLRAFDAAQHPEHWSDMSQWRYALMNVEQDLRARGLAAGNAEFDGARRDAVELARRLWAICPCVQAVWALQTLYEGQAGQEHLWDAWLQEQRAATRENAATILCGGATADGEDGESRSEQDDRYRRGVRVLTRPEWLIAATAALILADADVRFDVESALGIDTVRRPAGWLSMAALFVQWKRLASQMGLCSELPNLFPAMDYRDIAGPNGEDLRSVAEYTIDAAYRWYALAHYAARAMRQRVRAAWERGGPFEPFEAPGEDRHTTDEMKPLVDSALAAWRHACDRAGTYAYEDSCGQAACPYCSVQRIEDALYLPTSLLGCPMYSALLQWFATPAGYGSSDETDRMTARLTTAYVLGKAEGVAGRLRATAEAGERAALVDCVHRAVIAGRGVFKTFKSHVEAESDGRLMRCVRALRVYESFAGPTEAGDEEDDEDEEEDEEEEGG